MSFSREVKDFLGGFQAGWKMMDDSEYNAARSEYYRRSGGNKGKGSDNLFGYAPDDEEKPKNLFQRIFASTDTPEGGAGDVWERGSRNILLAEDKAAARGDADSLEKLQKMRLKFGTMIPQQKYAEGGPVEAIPTEPVAAPTEDTDGDGDFDIVDRMATAAQPGIDLALKNLEQKVSSAGGAVGDPNAGAELLARSEGAASQEEVDAIDQMIDPEGKLPPEARSAARIAAVTEFYLKQDQPEKAAELANKLLMYNKQNAETRGALAVRALQGGDIKSAAKLVRDMYNQDMPTGDLIQPAVATDGDIVVNEDGTVPVKIVRGGVTQEEVNATPEMIQQVASTAGQSWTQRLLQANAELKKRQAATGTAKSSGGASGTSADLSTALQGVKSAADVVRALPEDATEEQRAAAMKQLDAAEAKARNVPVKGKNAVWAEQNREKLIAGAKGAMPGQRPAGASAGTAEERKAAIEDAELGLLNRAAAVTSERNRALGDPTNIRSEGAREEIGRRKAVEDQRASAIDARKAEINYARGKGRKEFEESYETRIEPFRKSLDSLLNEGAEEAKSGKVDPNSVIKMEKREKELFLDLVDRVASKNDRNPDTIVRALVGMAKQVNGPRPVVDPRGIVSYNGVRLNIDGTDLLELARMRGQAANSFRQAVSKDYQAKADRESARGLEALNVENRFGPLPADAQPRANEMLQRLEAEIASREASLPNVPERRRRDFEILLNQKKQQRDNLRARMGSQAIPAQ